MVAKFKAKYQVLEELAGRIKNTSIKELFEKDSNRFTAFSKSLPNLLFDFSKNLIDASVLSQLVSLSSELAIKEHIQAMFNGEKINKTENRAVLHVALRGSTNPSLVVDGINVKKSIDEVNLKLHNFADKFYNSELKNKDGDSIDTVINIGIGGSDLGPRMALQALRSYSNRAKHFYFVSNVDPADLEEVLLKIDPKKSLFIIASKTFTTQETLQNANIAKSWLKQKLGEGYDIGPHFVALSTNDKAVKDFGIAESQTFPFWDFVGGRYSLASAIGLIVRLAVGNENFNQLLKGMQNIDYHFLKSEPADNIPLLMALIGFWYNNFLNAASIAVLPYSADLSLLPSYLQQLDMESNGKMYDKNGENVKWQTAPVVWGGAGTDSQHSFFQLLHQGTKIVATDFIGFCNTKRQNKKNHDILMSNFFAQQQALSFGKSYDQALAELKNNSNAEYLAKFKSFNGNRPSNCFLFHELTPFSLGQIIALYEHKVFCQGVLWDIFSFDQWGVELGKELAKNIASIISNSENNFSKLDSSTASQLKYYIDNK